MTEDAIPTIDLAHELEEAIDETKDRKALVDGALLGIIVGAAMVLLTQEFGYLISQGLLWLTVGIYVGMGFMDSEKAGLRELMFSAPTLALTVAGVLLSPWYLVAAWLSHPIYDMLHESGVIKTKVHHQVAPFCISFDVILAVATAYLAIQ